jgi:hypothetical protein
MSHLKDLFRDGEEVVVTDTRGNEYPIWVMRPSTLQQEEAREKANGRLARFKLEARDKTSDRYVAIKLAYEEMGDYDELISLRLKHDENEAHEYAFNTILYEEDENGEPNKWIKDERYFNLISAIADRMEAIEKYNKQMADAGADDRIDSSTDEQLGKLLEEQAEFQTEVEEIKNRHLAEQEAKHRTMTLEELREDLITMSIDLDARMTWYEDYKNRMIYFACRYVDDHKKFYFDSQDDVMELPSYVKTQLFAAYERIDRGTSDLKNSLSLPSS